MVKQYRCSKYITLQGASRARLYCSTVSAYHLRGSAVVAACIVANMFVGFSSYCCTVQFLVVGKLKINKKKIIRIESIHIVGGAGGKPGENYSTGRPPSPSDDAFEASFAIFLDLSFSPIVASSFFASSGSRIPRGLSSLIPGATSA